MDSASFERGIALFNQERYFDAHEVLEDAWRESSGEERLFLQGLVQVAVGLHHHSTGNLAGARGVLARAAANLSGYPDRHAGIALAPLRRALEAWQTALAGGLPAPPPPRLEVAPPDDKISAPMKDATTQKRPDSAGAVGVPLLDLARQYDTIREEVMAAIDRVCRSQKFVLGPEVQEFEREAAAYCGAKEAVGCASGTDALWLSLLAAGVQPGDEVITSAFTFFASASTIARCGARPVLMDVDPETLNLNPRLVERRLAQYRPARLRAVMPVHLFGQCADMDAFEALGREHGLAIIEDAAQAFGAAWRGRRAGSLGHSAGFSFYPTKNLSAFGDGGLVTTNDSACADRLRVLRNHGSRQRYYHEEIGWNSRLDSVQAAVLRVKLKYLDGWNNQRRQVAAAYNRLFAEAGLADKPDTPVRRLGSVPQAHHVYHQYVVRVPRRDHLRAFLSERRIGTEIYYPLPLHLQQAFAYLGYGPGDLPESEQAAKEVLALPIFPELTEDEQRTVVNAIADFYS